MTISMEKELELRGCSPIKEIIIPNQQLMDLSNELSSLPIANYKYGIRRMSLEDAVYDGQYYLDGSFKLHTVPYLKIIETKLRQKPRTILREVHPYRIPLSPVKERAYGIVSERFAKDGKCCFLSIGLVEPLSELTSSSYVHEITHTQLDSQKGIYKDFFNLEVISIFLQLSHAALLNVDETVLRLLESNRIYEIKELTKEQQEFAGGKIELSEYDQYENSKYIQSDLTALNLFAKYYHGSAAVQREMLVDVQKIFDGKITVEEYISKYDSTFQESIESQILRKHLRRR